jgi:SAM-dependent methyltransferase
MAAQRMYLMGRTAAETQRLIMAGKVLNPGTRRMLADAGLVPGMRVLDIGTGAGDVALIAAELVGPTGSVVAVDQNPDILRTAHRRARAAGQHHITFVAGDSHTVEPAGHFDAVVGRLVLMYIRDASEVARRLAGRLNPGGIVAFQELNLSRPSIRSHPEIPLWTQAWGWLVDTASRAGVPAEAGFELHRVLVDAGLPAPTMRLESLVESGPDALSYTWFADSLRSMMPLVERYGVANADEVGIDTLADRLRADTVAANAVLRTPDVVSAWTWTS